MILDWFKRTKRTAHTRAYTQGWCWAAGQLLEGKPVDQIRFWAEYGEGFDGKNPWDDGVKAACDTWEKKGLAK